MKNLKNIKDNQQLEVISLLGSDIFDDEIQTLCELPKLQLLYLDANFNNAEGLKKLGENVIVRNNYYDDLFENEEEEEETHKDNERIIK